MPGEYSLTIYRNDEFVAGLIQQVFNIGLPMDEIRETLNASGKQESNEASASGKASGGFTLPWVADTRAEISGAGKMTGGEDARDEYKNHLTFQYTQANFLHNVRKELNKQDLITAIDDVSSVDELEPGTFVEFSAAFEPNEINSILDLATPDLVAAITRWLAKKDQREKFDHYYAQGNAEFQKFLQRSNLDAEARAEIAAAATRAVRQDFRNETTREYFGKVVGGSAKKHVTAITICDTEYFSSQDKDRILDGIYTVFGKVTEVSNKGVSILSRNKVLNRVRQPALDQLNAQMRSATGADMFNAQIKLNLKPPIVKVIPIAIYI